jgi:hypothetical protein
MDYKLTFILVAAFFIPASFSNQDDVILAFTKQATEDTPLYQDAANKKTEVMKTLGELKVKADQLFQKRQAHQNDAALESSVLVLAEKVLELTAVYFPIENKSLETAKSNIHLVKELAEHLKKRP